MPMLDKYVFNTSANSVSFKNSSQNLMNIETAEPKADTDATTKKHVKI